MSIVQSENELRIAFFNLLFEGQEGYLCLASKNGVSKIFTQKFYQWPHDINNIAAWIEKYTKTCDLYFCVNLLEKPDRKKQLCLPGNIVWSDLDKQHPDELDVPPSIVIESSPNHYQGIWRLTTTIEPELAESYSKRIAYGSAADKTGWDLTQLLRVPFTFNFKYKGRPRIMLTRALETKAPPLIFEKLPQVPAAEQSEAERALEKDMPDPSKFNVQNIIFKYSLQLKETKFLDLMTKDPDDIKDWSAELWHMIHICLEANMSPEETFAVCNSAPCNKYERDARPLVHLWRDVLKADVGQKKIAHLNPDWKPLLMPVLIPEKPSEETFIDEYYNWAIEATDAVPEFHNLAAFMLLSCIVSNSVRLETSYGLMVPNIWGMILGDSTLTRKTTAMRMVIDILGQLDPTMILATDGSVEGLLSGLEDRPNKTSLFYRDELSGFFESINKRDYLAGMPEQFTALYDVPPFFIRRLRKETIRIENPIFIFFGGGVRDRVYEALSEEYIISGFMPRFLVVSGDTDLNRLRRTGPQNNAGIAKRAKLVSRVADLYENYGVEFPHKILGQTVMMPPRIMAELTRDAWETYGKIEEKMVKVASDSHISHLALPTFERLSRSLLKLAIIVAAARQTPVNNKIEVTHNDVWQAAWYIQQWGIHSVDLIQNATKRSSEKILDKICRAIERHPGITKAMLLQWYHLSSRDAEEILGNLEDRMLIKKEKAGRGYRYWVA